MRYGSWCVLVAMVGLAGEARAQTTFTSVDGALIPRASGVAVGRASLYPIPITVTGLTGIISDIRVRMEGFTHARPIDVDMVLVGPTGNAAVLMSDAGGNAPLNDVTFTFQDGATPIAPQTIVANSTVSPADYDVPYEALPNITNLGEASLRPFVGTAPNGTWQLYINDDAPVSPASLVDGSVGALFAYSLIITTTGTLNSPPVLDNSLDLVLPSIAEDDPNPPGTLLSSLLAGITDSPLAVKGVAVTFAQLGFQYSADGGATWLDVFGANPNNMLALPAAPSVRVRFLPGLNYSGTTAVFNFRAWDRTSSTPFQFFSPLLSNAISTTSESVSIVVTPVNDAPVIAPITDQSTTEDTQLTVPITVTDVDNLFPTVTVTAAPNTVIQTITLNPAPNRAIVVDPVPNASGTVQLTVTANDGALTAVRTFNVTFTPVNDAPVIAGAATASMNEDAMLTQNVTVTDVDSPVAAISPVLNIGNATLFPAGTATLTGSNGVFTLRFQPPANLFGSSMFSISAGDGTNTTMFNGTITVLPVNDAPTVTLTSPASTQEDTVLGPVEFVVADVDDPTGALAVTGMVAGHGTVMTGLGPDPLPGVERTRTYTYMPGLNETTPSVITLTVRDGAGGEATGTVTVNIVPVNDPPTIAAVGNVTLVEDGSLAIPLVITDPDSAMSSLVLSAVSNQPTLVDGSGLTFSTGATPLLTITPVANAYGSCTVTVTVLDDVLMASTSFDVAVSSVDDAPVLTAPADSTIPRGQATTLNFTVTDIDSPTGALTFAGRSSDTTLFPAGSITFGGADDARTITLTPAGMLTGNAVITIVLQDGADAGPGNSVNFNVAVGTSVVSSSSGGGGSGTSGVMASSQGSSGMMASSAGASSRASGSSAGGSTGASSGTRSSSGVVAASSEMPSSGAASTGGGDGGDEPGGCNSLTVVDGVPFPAALLGLMLALWRRRRS